MESILNKNTLGVEHIRNGRCEEAKKAFTAAISDLTLVHGQQKEAEENDRDDGRPGVPREIRRSFLRMQVEACPIQDSPCQTSPSHTFYMYRNVFLGHLDPDSDHEGTITEQESACLTTLIMFNLALTLHYKFDRDKDSKVGNLSTKILLFYKKAWETIKIDTWLNPEHQSYRDSIAFGSVINMGAMLYELGKYQKAWQCFKPMKTLLLQSDVVEGMETEQLMTNIFLVEERLMWAKRKSIKTIDKISSLNNSARTSLIPNRSSKRNTITPKTA
mmetsp:Transcript_17789/g.26323  ORF Transcript_17789/g.26323 Transcript_17789/m.26323 type:complete len:274 (-) Transcript_17789:548-1369(-)